MEWLDIADKVGSVVGAASGILLLIAPRRRRTGAVPLILCDGQVWRVVRATALQELSEPADADIARLRRRVDALIDESPVLWPLRIWSLDWPSAMRVSAIV